MDAEKAVLLNRLNRLIIGRPLLVTPLLSLFLLFNYDAVKNTLDLTIFFFLIGATWCLTFLYIFSIRWIRNHNGFAALQLVCDLFLITLLTGITGTVESPFSILYIVTIVSSALFFYQKGGVIMATAATGLLGMITFTQTTVPLGGDVSPAHLTPFFSQNKELFYRLFLHAIAFYSVGTVIGQFFHKMHEKERGLSKLRVLHEDIIKSIPSGVLTTDTHGTITFFNFAASQIIGVSSREAIGAVWWDLFSWEEIQRQYQTLTLSGIPQHFEGYVMKKEGRWGVTAVGHAIPARGATSARGAAPADRFLSVTISSLRNDQGEITGVIGIFQDLTHVKQLEEEMDQKRRLATIGEMAAGMAHEIRNPLASISGSIQLLKDELSLSGDHHQLMEIALHEAERLNNIITEFILYARPMTPRRRWTVLSDLLSESLELLKNSKEITDQINIQLKLAKAPTRMFIDPDQIKQVFWNLSINAFQAMPQGGTLVITVDRVGLQGEQEPYADHQVEICFSDTGGGIQKEDLSRIFYPFFTTKSSGSGLGLAIVQRIIEQHVGSIEVESTPHGTSFRIFLPEG
jgi:two-component system sensor histidine kinase PilS (NtrC family)